jgi:hypothetical protein
LGISALDAVKPLLSFTFGHTFEALAAGVRGCPLRVLWEQTRRKVGLCRLDFGTGIPTARTASSLGAPSWRAAGFGRFLGLSNTWWNPAMP